jgi:RNA polymerase sigma-70 factor (ECF subfamily)
MQREVERVFREEWSHAVAILTRVLGDLELAEDAVQDAFATALERWPSDGVPRTPGAWIVTTARNRAIDRIRREKVFQRKASSSAACNSSRPKRTT